MKTPIPDSPGWVSEQPDMKGDTMSHKDEYASHDKMNSLSQIRMPHPVAEQVTLSTLLDRVQDIISRANGLRGYSENIADRLCGGAVEEVGNATKSGIDASGAISRLNSLLDVLESEMRATSENLDRISSRLG